MDRHQLSQWKKHPVTIILIELLEEHIKALRDCAAFNDWTPETVHKLYKIQGQIQTMDEIREVATFLNEKLTKEVIEDVDVEEDTQSI